MRQFILEKNPDKKGLVFIEGKDFRYLRQVLRAKVGDMINLRLADGTLHNSTVVSIDDKTKIIKIQLCAATGESITRGVQAEDIEHQENFCGPEYVLFQFIPKPQKLELIVRQATECGIKYIVPVIGEYSEKNSVEAIKGSKKERLERIIKEARQQSGSPVQTQVLEPMTLEEVCDYWGTNENSIGFVLSERDDGDVQKSVRELLEQKKAECQIKKIGIACGSEGGISPQEVEILTKKGLFKAIHFSVNILRCETAALYGIAAVQTGV